MLVGTSTPLSTGCRYEGGLLMSVTSDAAAEEGTPTYVTRFDGVAFRPPTTSRSG